MKKKILELLPTRMYLELKQWDYKRSKRESYEQLQNLRRVTTENGYSYKPFDDKKAIFVHIPKCAGVSVNTALFGNLSGGHTTLEEYLNIFEPKCIISYFKFTIVRNPWDRLVSAYFFLKKGGFGEKDKRWFENELGSYSDFEDFVINWVNKNNIWKWHHFRPQHHYMLDNREKVPLDFVAFLENIKEDFSYIAKCIDVDSTLGSSNKSKHETYLDYYNNRTKDIVAKAYSEDIRLLGYSFDNSSLPQQLLDRGNRKNYSLRQ